MFLLQIRLAVFLLLLAVPALQAQGGRNTAYKDTTGEGKAMVEELLLRRPSEDSQILGLLKIRPAEGPTLEVPVKMTIHITAQGYQDIYETQPANGRPGEMLVIEHRAGQPNKYLFGEMATPSTPPKLRELSPSEIWLPLAGSDFYRADLGLEFLHWPSQKIVAKEMRKGRSCRVVESINPTANGPYSRVLSWLDFETSNIIMAEGYDRQNKLLKEFSVKKLKKIDDYYQLKEIEIRNDQTDSRTLLEFNLEVRE